MKKVYQLNNLDCAVCAQKMQDAIEKVDGVENAQVSFLLQKMTLETEEGLNEKTLMKKIGKIIHKIEPDCEIVF